MSTLRRIVIGGAIIGGLIVSAGLLATLGDPELRRAGSAAAQAPSGERAIAVRGEGRVMVMPDTARVTLGVQIRDTDLSVAQAEASRAMDAVIQSLRDNGIEERQIRTVVFSVSVERDWNREGQPIIGYSVHHLVGATVRPMDRAAEVIDDAVRAGANTVSDVVFTVEDVDAAVRQAREQAMNDARQRAEHLASLAGVTLGMPIAISEGAAPPPIPMAMAIEGRAEMDAAAPPIQPGETEVTVTLAVSYAIE